MYIENFHETTEQYCEIHGKTWCISRLIDLSKDFETFEIPLDFINLSHVYERINLRNMVSHMKAVLNADLSYPIILDEDGIIMDGRHRIMKALLEGKKTIKAVRFDINPTSCNEA